MIIDRTGTFRGRIVDHAVGVTKNEYPQWVAQLLATEIYDVEEQTWVNLADVGIEANEITAFLVLFGSKGETLTCQQVKKVTGWDGLSFQALNELDLSETGIQFRVAENEYNNKITLQVEWIDEYDAVPGRAVRKLNPNELKELDAKYAQLLKASGVKKAPAKADKPRSPGVVIARNTEPTHKAGPVRKKALPIAPPTDEVTGHCTKDEAWDAVANDEMWKKGMDDEKMSKHWQAAIHKAGGGKHENELTEKEWFLVKDDVMNKVCTF